MSNREKIFADIMEERKDQDALWGGYAHDRQHSHEDWLAILIRHLGLAAPESAGVKNDPVRWRRQMVRVAAIVVAALEVHDQKMQKIFGEHQAGSGF